MRRSVLFLSWALCMGVAATEWITVTGYPGNDATFRWAVDEPMTLTHSYIAINSIRTDLDECYVISYSPGRTCVPSNNRVKLLVEPEEAQHLTYVQVDAIGFTLANVTLNDADRYEIRNYGHDFFIGRAMLVFSLTLPQPLVRHAEEAILGRDVLIICVSSSRSVPQNHWFPFVVQYTWTVTHLGSPYRILTNGSLLIENLQKSDTGAAISCQAREKNSTLVSDESPALILDVYYLEQIQFSDGLDQQVVQCAANVTKKCQASCNPDCSYQWVDGEDNLITQDQDLVLMDVSEGTAPQVYICEARNTAGTLTKRFQIMKFSPEIVNFDISPAVTFQGNRTTLSCTLKTEARIVLIHAAMEIEGDVCVNKLEHTWETVDITQNGDYECRAENDYGVASRNVTLNVQSPPRVAFNSPNILAPQKFKVTLGSKFTFTIRLVSNPFPEITDTNLEHLSENGIHTSMPRDAFSVSIANPNITVTIEPITDANYGVYTLYTRNRYGHMLALFQITAPDLGPCGAVIGTSTAFTLVLAAGIILGTIWLLRKKISKRNQGSDENTTEVDQQSYQNTAFAGTALKPDSAAGEDTYDNIGTDHLGPEAQPSYETLSRPNQAPESDTPTTFEEVHYITQ